MAANENKAPKITNLEEPKALKEFKEITVPKLEGSKLQPPLTGSVNGKAFSLPRMKKVKVPPDVYEVVQRSIDAENYANEYSIALQKELKDKAKAEAELNS